MLKWTRTSSEGTSMSGLQHKRRSAAPSTPSSQPNLQSLDVSNGRLKKGVASNGSSSAHGLTLTYPAEASDDVNMNEEGGLVTLSVTLPSGEQRDINVDYNTPMMDLLVSLLAQCRLQPSGYSLQLVNDDLGGKVVNYKANQLIGSLPGRRVVIVAKEEKRQPRDKKDKPFEMTHRFTMNLPRGQKAVVRVSPLTVLGDLVTQVCQDKGLDLRRHVLQIPGQPGRAVDLRATIQAVGVHEMNLITVPLQPGGIHTQSMPDLSKPVPQADQPFPSYMPGGGSDKKKRGFLSFLKKDKSSKFKPGEASYNHMDPPATTTPIRRGSSPPSHRRVSDTPDTSSPRPMSMFVTTPSSALSPRDHAPSPHQLSITTTTKKKRRAPAPPGPPSQPPPEDTSTLNRIVEEVQISTDQSTTPTSTGSQQVTSTRTDQLSRLHSRNSSDSSGYHELTLSGPESPDATLHLPTKSKTSIDTTSIESGTDNLQAGDSPVRVSPITEENNLQQQQADVVSEQQVVASDTLAKKRKGKKAPAPPPGSGPGLSVTVQDSEKISESVVRTEAVVEVQRAEVEVNQEVEEVVLSESCEQLQQEPKDQVTSEPTEEVTAHADKVSPTHSTEDVTVTLTSVESPASDLDLDADDESKAFDINDILEGVVFEEEPKPLELTTGHLTDHQREETGEGRMMMEETSSVTSEDLEQEDVFTRSERPCAFVPPPPPSEPPPPEEPVVDLQAVTSDPVVLVDKETEVNEDNTSLAPQSLTNSPSTHPGGYKNEMAMFVERMSSLAVEPQPSEALDESQSSQSLSFLGSDTASDTGSVIHHGSDKGSLTRKSGAQISASSVPDKPEPLPEIAGDLNVSEEVMAPIETVPPPPEFGDQGEGQEEGEGQSEYYFSDPVEHLVIAKAPSEFDTSSEEKVSQEEITELLSDNLVMDHGEVLPEDPVEIVPPPPPSAYAAEELPDVAPVAPEPEPVMSDVKVAPVISPVQQVKPEPEAPREKEEFILTTEDLSGVSFLPSRPKLAKKPKNLASRAIPTHVSSTSLVLEHGANAKTSLPSSQPAPASTQSFPASSQPVAATSQRYTNESEYTSVKQHVSQISFQPKTAAENDSVLEEKPITLLNMPRMRPSSRGAELVPTFSDDSPSEAGSDLSAQRAASQLSVNSVSSSRKSSLEDSRPLARNGSLEGTDEERTRSRESSQSPSVLASDLQAQYQSLQAQMDVWQAQLARNQSLLAAQTSSAPSATQPDVTSDTLKTLQEQMLMQQTMMMQLQNSMVSLQQQKIQQAEQPPVSQPQLNGHRDVDIRPSSNVQSKSPNVQSVQPPAPPPISGAPKPLKSTALAPKPKPNRFERVLDPREELMIAIRTFQGRENLRSVPVTQTKWVHSNRL